jgi:hypothetical protein
MRSGCSRQRYASISVRHPLARAGPAPTFATQTPRSGARWCAGHFCANLWCAVLAARSVWMYAEFRSCAGLALTTAASHRAAPSRTARGRTRLTPIPRLRNAKSLSPQRQAGDSSLLPSLPATRALSPSVPSEHRGRGPDPLSVPMRPAARYPGGCRPTRFSAESCGVADSSVAGGWGRGCR